MLRDTYISRTLSLAGWDSVPAGASTRYPEVDMDETLLEQTDLVLLSSEPYRFRARHVAELRALPVDARKSG